MILTGASLLKPPLSSVKLVVPDICYLYHHLFLRNGTKPKSRTISTLPSTCVLRLLFSVLWLKRFVSLAPQLQTIASWKVMLMYIGPERRLMAQVAPRSPVDNKMSILAKPSPEGTEADCMMPFYLNKDLSLINSL
jgi:hypothetical protein